MNGLFIYAGRTPNTAFLNDELPLDGSGFLVTNEKMETALSRVYAAGDVRRTPLRQVITAAATSALHALMEL